MLSVIILSVVAPKPNSSKIINALEKGVFERFILNGSIKKVLAATVKINTLIDSVMAVPLEWKLYGGTNLNIRAIKLQCQLLRLYWVG